jgi:hypothetical protein
MGAYPEIIKILTTREVLQAAMERPGLLCQQSICDRRVSGSFSIRETNVIRADTGCHFRLSNSQIYGGSP